MRIINGKPVIRCSALNQLLSCNGSLTVVDKILRLQLGGKLEVDDERDSWDGNWCHFHSAERFITEFGALPPAGGLPPARVPADYEPSGLSKWVSDFYVRAVMEDTPGDWAMEVEAEMLQEFSTFWLSGHVDVDAVSADATLLQFDDLKRGINPVDPADCNWQVLGYFGLFKLSYPSLKRVRGRIIQPLLSEEIGRRVSAVVIDETGTYDDDGKISEAAIDAIVPYLDQRISAALKNPRQLDSGPKQCRWCLGAQTLQCPAVIAEREAMKMTLTDEALERIKAEPDLKQLVEWACAKKLLEPRLKKAWEQLKERIAKTGEVDVDGVRCFLKDTLGPRECTDVAAAWERIVEKLDAERAYACMDLSFTEAEKQLAQQFDLPVESKKGKSGKGELDALIGDLIKREPGKQLTVVI